ncbi:MAG: hypothetical protein KAR00_01000 [Candidatus Pacebacteria bacterium]|nr:hypothetical protein [Candidatus Paceibacterota bacterium]
MIHESLGEIIESRSTTVRGGVAQKFSRILCVTDSPWGQKLRKAGKLLCLRAIFEATAIFRQQAKRRGVRTNVITFVRTRVNVDSKESHPRVETLKKIEDALGVKIDNLIK